MTNRKWHACIRLVPKSTTLDDLEGPLRSLFQNPSVARWHCVKTMQARITKFSPTYSPSTLVFAIRSSSRNSKGFTPSESVKWESVVAVSQKRCKSLLMTNRKSHTTRPFDWCQNQRRGWPWTADMQSIAEKMHLLTEPTTNIWMKIEPYILSAAKM